MAPSCGGSRGTENCLIDVRPGNHHRVHMHKALAALRSVLGDEVESPSNLVVMPEARPPATWEY